MSKTANELNDKFAAGVYRADFTSYDSFLQKKAKELLAVEKERAGRLAPVDHLKKFLKRRKENIFDSW